MDRNDPALPPWWLLPAASVGLAGILTAAIAAGGLDQRLASILRDWNQAAGGDLHDRWWSHPSYLVPGILVVAIVLGVLARAVASRWRSPGRRTPLPMLWWLLALAIGPGLLVNVALKDGWGRPRPRQTAGLGGDQPFHQPWQPGGGHSFPCGHVAVPAMAVAAAWLTWRRERPRLARWGLVGGGLLTAWVAAVRLLAGAHWLSDVVWAVAIAVATTAVLHRLLRIGMVGERGPPLASGTAAAGAPALPAQ